MRSCTAIAPSSTANLGSGFDVFGLGLGPLKDSVTVRRGPGRSGRIHIKLMGGEKGKISCSVTSNCAGLVIQKMAHAFGIRDDLSITVRKGIPVGAGLGSSAASAAAAAVAFDRLFDLHVEKRKLVEYAAEGELASAGTRHYDNVGASLLGGFVIVRTVPELELIRIVPPKDLFLVVAVPRINLPRRKTAFARTVLPKRIGLHHVVQNIASASTVVAGFVQKDVELIARGIQDAIVEPARKRFIPGFEGVRVAAMAAGALAVTISGAGPAVISFLASNKNVKRVEKAMANGFKEANINSKIFICQPSRGARVILEKSSGRMSHGPG